MLNRCTALKRQGKDVTSELVKEALGETAVVVASSIFDLPFGRKYVKKGVKGFLDDKQRQQIEANERSLEGEYLSWFQRIRNWLQNVSVIKPNLKPLGNSYQLISKLVKSQQYSKLDTRIRRALALLYELSGLELIQNDQIPIPQKTVQVSKPSSNVGAYETLKHLESKLRTHIQARLERISSSWWSQCIPEDVRRRAEERKVKNEKPWPWHTQPDLHPVHYIDFTDYFKIISRRDNWNKTFKQVFGDKEIIFAKFRELEPIRNAIAHSRELTDKETEKLRLYSDEIITCLGGSK